MEDRETPRMRKYGESKTTRIMMATVPHVTSGSDLENFKPMDFCSTECTIFEGIFNFQYSSRDNHSYTFHLSHPPVLHKLRNGIFQPSKQLIVLFYIEYIRGYCTHKIT